MRALLIAFGLLLALASPALAEERIDNFISDVTVNADATLSVRETIAVTAEDRDIRHGILRDFPTVYTDRHGVRIRVGFTVNEVNRDGRSEPYAIESISNGKRIRIGDKDVYLDNGPHTYEITYTTTRQIGFFNDFDELYWNATGNGWTFPIRHAAAMIHLPPGARISQNDAYTGYQGAKGRDFRIIAATGNEYHAETTRPLEASEGFTVAVAWQKGIVAAPSDSDKLSWWLADNAGIFALLAGLIIAAIYYVYAWNKVGRDPPKGTIIPLFSPPPGLAPAGARFVWKMGFDDKGFAAALVGLAVKGRLKINDAADKFAVTKLSPASAAVPLTASEQALYTSLPSGTTTLKQSNHAAVRAVRSALEKALTGEYEGSVFLRNLGWFGGGAVISIASLVIAALLLPSEDAFAGLFAAGFSGVWWGVVLTFAWAAIRGFIRARGLFSRIGSLFQLLFIIPFAILGIGGPALLMFSTGSPLLYMLVGSAVLLGVMNLVFFFLLRAPTVPGRKLLDQLEGFRMYMTTAEEERLKVLHPPEKTPELFERYLPYALALDCENEWNSKFAAVLAAAAAAGAAAPVWYSGSHWDAGRSGGFTDSLGSSLSSSVASASTAPGSSSGSSGGGSSGGGGGGGGGSGW